MKRHLIAAMALLLLAQSTSLMARERKDSGSEQPCATQEQNQSSTSKAHKQKDETSRKKDQRDSSDNYNPLAGIFG